MTQSMLFVPGHQSAMLQRSLQSGAHAVIWDLEDAVAPADKDLARRSVSAALTAVSDPSVPIFVRIHAVRERLLDLDLAGIVGRHLQGVVLAKAESRSDIQELARCLDTLERARGVSEGATRICGLLETGLGVLHAYDIATASPRVDRVCFGAEDFTLDLGIRRTAEGTELAHARGQVVLAAGAAKVPAFDTVYADLSDMAGLARECRMGRDLGFRGKLAIHPNQLETIHGEFGFSDHEIADAERIVRAFDHASSGGVMTVDGKMVDAPIVARARRILSDAGR